VPWFGTMKLNPLSQTDALEHASKPKTKRSPKPSVMLTSLSEPGHRHAQTSSTIASGCIMIAVVVTDVLLDQFVSSVVESVTVVVVVGNTNIVVVEVVILLREQHWSTTVTLHAGRGHSGERSSVGLRCSTNMHDSWAPPGILAAKIDLLPITSGSVGNRRNLTQAAKAWSLPISKGFVVKVLPEAWYVHPRRVGNGGCNPPSPDMR